MDATRPAQPRGNPALDFLRGARDVLRGAGFLLSHPGLWIWALMPFVINAAVLIAMWLLANHWLWGVIKSHVVVGEGWWWAALGWLLHGLAAVVMLIVGVVLFIPVATIIAGPFNDILSEKVERHYAGLEQEPMDWRATLRSTWIGLVSTVRLSLLTLGLIALTIPLHWVVGIGSLLAALASAAITIRFIALEYTSYCMDRRSYDYRRRQDFLRRNRARTIGLGLAAFAIMLIPFVNVLFISVSAVAGTILFVDTEHPALVRAADAPPSPPGPPPAPAM